MKQYLSIISLLILAACNGNDNDDPEIPIVARENVPVAAPMTFTISNQFPHDTGAFTEGLQIYKGKFYEGTGEFESSALQISDIKTGKVEQKHNMGSNIIFGEGINVFKGKIYQLTWQSHIVYVYDEKDITKPIQTLRWPYEGWGMTNNGTDLIISDGTANIYFVNPADFSVRNTLQVKDNTGFVQLVNELEYVDGFIFANIWQKDEIIKINPANGNVVGRLVISGLPQQYFPKEIIPGRTDVMNGIAYDSTTKKMYITGKRWPKVFEGRMQ